MWGLAAARPVAEQLAGLWWTWHAAPSSCQERLIDVAAFCLGSVSRDRQLVVYLELGVLCLLIAGAFAVGRFTADRPWPCDRPDQRRVVRIRRPRVSRFNGDGASGSSVTS